MSGGTGKFRSVGRWVRALLGVSVVLGLVHFYLTHRDVPEPYVEWQIPEHPIAKAAYDYAHSIKLPDSVPKPVPFKFCKHTILGFCFGRATRDEYFEHLCKTEAGEYVFKRVEGVEGVAELRPRRRSASIDEAQDPHKLEDPLTSSNGGEMTPYTDAAVAVGFVQPPGGKYSAYAFYLDSANGPKFVYAFRDPGADPNGSKAITTRTGEVIHWVTKTIEVLDTTLAYGLAIRGARRYRDREFGVAGVEIILVERKTGDVLGLRRDFARSPDAPSTRFGINWDNAKSCLKAEDFSTRRFVYSILIPKQEN